MNTTQLLVARILERALNYQWSYQGLGMLRLYLSKDVRVHIWCPRLAVKNVSTIHDHPWDFDSEIVCGWIVNRIWEVKFDGYGRSWKPKKDPSKDPFAVEPPTHMMGRIRCGEGGGLVPDFVPLPVRLRSRERSYVAGDKYTEAASLLHESLPEEGTVTIITRRPKPDPDHAIVCWPIGTEWVSAEPRPASSNEIEIFANAALERMREDAKHADNAK